MSALTYWADGLTVTDAEVPGPPSELSDVLDGSRLTSGATVRLGPRDVRVLVGERGTSVDDPGGHRFRAARNTGLCLTGDVPAPRPGTVPSRAG
ncbi:hypothetical protein [Streptomyces sp. NPDC001139]